MDENNNGHVKHPIALSVVFHEDAQGVELVFDKEKVRSWEFVLALLDMAKHKAETEYRMGMAAALQARALEAQKTQDILRRTGMRSV